MNQTITGRIKASAALVDPNRYGRSDRSAAGRWFWEIDRMLLFCWRVLIGFGLIAVAAACPAAAQRYSGGSVRFAELHYFYRQIAWIALSHAGDDRHLDAAARPAQAAVAGRRAGLPRRAGAGALARRRR